MSQWKKGIPTTPGYYWVYVSGSPATILYLEKDGDTFSMGDEVPLNLNRNLNLAEEYWLGPIEAPAFDVVEIKRKVR